jgi:type I restriction enzyme S subunit
MTPRLPKNWKGAHLRDLVFLQRGFDITQAKQVPGPYPVISSSGITSYHNEAKAVGPGVIVGRKGTVGSVHFSPSDFWPHDTTLWSKELQGNDARFVFYYLLTVNLKRFDVGSSNPTLNRNHIHDLPVWIPPLDEQRRIASVLSSFDDLTENNRRRMTLLEDAARQLYREWFIRLRFPGHEHRSIRDGVPEGWKSTTAIASMDILSGGTPKTTVSDYWDGDIPFYTPKDASDACYTLTTERSITERGLKNCNSRLYPPDTVFISARGTVGKLSLAARPMAMSQSCYALVGKGHVSQLFLFSALREAIDHFKQHASGAVFDAIVVDTFKLIPFTVPDQKAVRLFEETIGPLFRQVANLTEQNDKLRAARDLLLPRLMSGEIAV